jgi:hypothetical protein
LFETVEVGRIGERREGTGTLGDFPKRVEIGCNRS